MHQANIAEKLLKNKSIAVRRKKCIFVMKQILQIDENIVN